MAPPPSPSRLLDWRVPYEPLLAMIWVSRESEPLLGLRLPSLVSRPSPKPTAAEGMPIARISAAATTYRTGERRFKGASLVGFRPPCDTRNPVPVAVARPE